jgi:hypothetical protein
MAVRFVMCALSSIQNRPRRVERASKGSAAHAVPKGDLKTVREWRIGQCRHFPNKIFTADVICIKRQNPLRIDVIKPEIALGSERIELSLNHVHPWMSPYIPEGAIITEAIDDKYSRRPVERRERSLDVRHLIECENERCDAV